MGPKQASLCHNLHTKHYSVAATLPNDGEHSMDFIKTNWYYRISSKKRRTKSKSGNLKINFAIYKNLQYLTLPHCLIYWPTKYFCSAFSCWYLSVSLRFLTWHGSLKKEKSQRIISKGLHFSFQLHSFPMEQFSDVIKWNNYCKYGIVKLQFWWCTITQ